MKPMNKQELSAYIQEKETQFQAASPAERRVLVANDVLLLLKEGQIKASCGSWFHLDQSLWEEMPATAIRRDLRSVLHQPASTPICSACALGALFCSLVRYTDQFELSPYYGGTAILGDFKSYVSEHFSMEQICMIEIAFEIGNGRFHPALRRESEALQFGRLCHTNPTIRMAQIFQNIIDNEGDFLPSLPPKELSLSDG